MESDSRGGYDCGTTQNPHQWVDNGTERGHCGICHEKGPTSMLKYSVTFFGRTLGAIGICYMITDTVEAENKEAALLKLYDKYDTVSGAKFKVIEGPTS